MMNKKMNKKILCFSHGIHKKGISAIVATVLIILITVAAVAIVWAAIIPMISDKLDAGAVCFDADRMLTVKNEIHTCLNSSDYVNVQVSLGSEDIGLVGIQVLVSTDGTDKSEIITTNLPVANENKVYTTSIAYPGAQTVSVAAIIEMKDGTNRTCTSSNEVVLNAC